MEAVLAVLPALVFLACPILMAACYFGTRRMGDDATPSAEVEAGSQLPEARIAALQQLHAIQAELTTLQVQFREANAPQAPVSSREDQLADVVAETVYATRHPA